MSSGRVVNASMVSNANSIPRLADPAMVSIACKDEIASLKRSPPWSSWLEKQWLSAMLSIAAASARCRGAGPQTDRTPVCSRLTGRRRHSGSPHSAWLPRCQSRRNESSFASVVADHVDTRDLPVAVSKISTAPATVTVELTRIDGAPAGLTGTLSIPANGQTALFLDQIPGLGSVPLPFQGVLRVSSASRISVVGLRGRYNERGDLLITTTSPVDEAETQSAAELFFPHIVDGGGYTTQFVLFSG